MIGDNRAPLDHRLPRDLQTQTKNPQAQHADQLHQPPRDRAMHPAQRPFDQSDQKQQDQPAEIQNHHRNDPQDQPRPPPKIWLGRVRQVLAWLPGLSHFGIPRV